MRIIVLVAFVIFFIGGSAGVKATEWEKGEIIQSPFVCKSVQAIVDYGVARVEVSVQVMGRHFQTKMCFHVPPNWGLTLEEHMLTFPGLETGNKPITFEVWRVEGTKENYIGMLTRPEAVKRGFAKKIGLRI